MSYKEMQSKRMNSEIDVQKLAKTNENKPEMAYSRDAFSRDE